MDYIKLSMCLAAMYPIIWGHGVTSFGPAEMHYEPWSPHYTIRHHHHEASHSLPIHNKHHMIPVTAIEQILQPSLHETKQASHYYQQPPMTAPQSIFVQMPSSAPPSSPSHSAAMSPQYIKVIQIPVAPPKSEHSPYQIIQLQPVLPSTSHNLPPFPVLRIQAIPANMSPSLYPGPMVPPTSPMAHHFPMYSGQPIMMSPKPEVSSHYHPEMHYMPTPKEHYKAPTASETKVQTHSYESKSMKKEEPYIAPKLRKHPMTFHDPEEVPESIKQTLKLADQYQTVHTKVFPEKSTSESSHKHSFYNTHATEHASVIYHSKPMEHQVLMDHHKPMDHSSLNGNVYKLPVFAIDRLLHHPPTSAPQHEPSKEVYQSADIHTHSERSPEQASSKGVRSSDLPPLMQYHIQQVHVPHASSTPPKIAQSVAQIITNPVTHPVQQHIIMQPAPQLKLFPVHPRFYGDRLYPKQPAQYFLKSVPMPSHPVEIHHKTVPPPPVAVNIAPPPPIAVNIAPPVPATISYQYVSNAPPHMISMTAEDGSQGHVPSVPRDYAFEYLVNDAGTKDLKSQKESRNGDVVKGMYSLVQPDGLTRIVTYQADDKNGFTAQVKTIAPGAPKEGNQMP